MGTYRFIKDGYAKAEFTDMRQFVQYTINEVKFCSLYEHLNDFMVTNTDNGLDVFIVTRGEIG